MKCFWTMGWMRRPSVHSRADAGTLDWLRVSRKSGCADVYAERAVEDFGAAADESGVGGDQRAGRMKWRRRWGGWR